MFSEANLKSMSAKQLAEAIIKLTDYPNQTDKIRYAANELLLKFLGK